MTTDVEEKPDVGTSRWDTSGQIFLTGNRGWGVAPDCTTVCLGLEGEIKAYLNGGALPKHISQAAIEVLTKISQLMEDKENARTAGDIKVQSVDTQRPIRTGNKRARLTSHPEYKPKDTRQVTIGKGLSSRTFKPAKPGIPYQFGLGLIRYTRLCWLKRTTGKPGIPYQFGLGLVEKE